VNELMEATIMGSANKALVLTMPARRSFGIIARHKGLGGGLGFVLPVRALAWPHNAGVSTLSCIKSTHQLNKAGTEIVWRGRVFLEGSVATRLP